MRNGNLACTALLFAYMAGSAPANADTVDLFIYRVIHDGGAEILGEDQTLFNPGSADDDPRAGTIEYSAEVGGGSYSFSLVLNAVAPDVASLTDGPNYLEASLVVEALIDNPGEFVLESSAQNYFNLALALRPMFQVGLVSDGFLEVAGAFDSDNRGIFDSDAPPYDFAASASVDGVSLLYSETSAMSFALGPLEEYSYLFNARVRLTDAGDTARVVIGRVGIVPLPATLPLLGVALFALGLRARRSAAL